MSAELINKYLDELSYTREWGQSWLIPRVFAFSRFDDGSLLLEGIVLASGATWMNDVYLVTSLESMVINPGDDWKAMLEDTLRELQLQYAENREQLTKKIADKAVADQRRGRKSAKTPIYWEMVDENGEAVSKPSRVEFEFS